MSKENVCEDCHEILYSPVPYCPFCGLALNLQARRDNNSESEISSVPLHQVTTEVAVASQRDTRASNDRIASPEHPSSLSADPATKEPEGFEQETQPDTYMPTTVAAGGSDPPSPPQTAPHTLPKTSPYPAKDISGRKNIFSGGIGKILLALGISAVAIATTFVFLSDGPTPELPNNRPLNSSEILEPDFVENYLAQSPDKYDALLVAQRLEESTHMGNAFLVYHYAARGGVGEASTAIAQMYDPSLSGNITSPLRPNASEALEWYKRGVLQGDTAANKGLRKLVKWLEQQAWSGDDKAQEILDSLE